MRNITGSTFAGFAARWGITSTISANADQVADPNQLVVVFDQLDNADPTVAAQENSFCPSDGRVRRGSARGVSFTPETEF